MNEFKAAVGTRYHSVPVSNLASPEPIRSSNTTTTAADSALEMEEEIKSPLPFDILKGAPEQPVVDTLANNNNHHPSPSQLKSSASSEHVAPIDSEFHAREAFTMRECCCNTGCDCFCGPYNYAKGRFDKRPRQCTCSVTSIKALIVLTVIAAFVAIIVLSKVL